MRISWSQPYNGGSNITAYQILILQSDGITFSPELSFCDGSTTIAVTTLSCSIPVSTLRTAPFSLTWGATVVGRVQAINIYGNSAFSISGGSGVLITNPDPPISLAEIFSSRTATTLRISWQDGPSNGGSPIIDYAVYSDQGLLTWTLLQTGVTTREYLATGLTIGVRYQFYVRSRNVFDFSASSVPVTILCAAAPLAPPAPTTVAVLDQIQISWSDGSNQGSSITSYQIFIRNRD